MARDSRSAFLRALAQVEPRIARAFEEAIQGVRSSAQRREIERAIERAIREQDVARGAREVLAALQLGSESFEELDRAMLEAFEAGVQYQQGALPKRPFPNSARRLVARFDYRHPEAERWTRESAARRVTEIAEDTREVVRQTVQEAVENQRSYRSVTRSLIGHVEGDRLKGGMIGLHSSQAEYVRRARQQLEDLDEGYFQRARRDKRFDGKVRKAIREGRKLNQSDVDKITGRYSDRLLRLRGETIARTEGNKAMQQGRTQQVMQLIERDEVPPEIVTKIWDAVLGPRTRDHHLELNGQERKWGEPFVSPATAYPMTGPHDDNAPGVDTVNCFPPWQRVLSSGITAGIRRNYRGDLVELSIGGEVHLTVTPNHPILTPAGWKPAGDLIKGDHVFARCGQNGRIVSASPDVHDANPRAQQLYDAAKALTGVVRPNGGVVDFHGEATGENVEIVSVPRSLRVAGDAVLPQRVQNLIFAHADIAHGRLLADRMVGLHSFVSAEDTDCAMSVGGSGPTVFRSEHSGGETVAFGNGGTINPQIIKATVDHGSGYANGSSDGVHGMTVGDHGLDAGKERTPLFLPVRLSMIRRSHHDGPVYNFESETSVLVSGNLVNHNCRCTMRLRINWAALAQ